jgi:hypothetical protein
MSTDVADGQEHRSESPTGIARCAPLDGQSAPYLVHGVAIGADEVTLGENGRKLWPAEELRRAAQTLVGAPLNKNHDDDDVDAVVGEVVDAGYEADVGVVFEAEVDDKEIATKIARGRLEVSIHAVHTSGGTTDDGALIAENIQFLDLSVVPRGAAPSNFVEAGTSPSEALASLSADDVAGMLDESPADASDATEDDDAPSEPSTSATADSDLTMTNDDSDSKPTDEAEASDTVDDGVDEEAELEEDVEAEATEADASDDSDDTELAELRDTVEQLQAENEELRHELEGVRMEYAERLAADSPFDADELTEKFSFDELQSKFESTEETLVEEAEDDVPAPQTGDVEGELSTSSDDHAEEIAELEEKIATYDEMGWDAAQADAEERLADLRE